jgi:uncharacterized protein YuzE
MFKGNVGDKVKIVNRNSGYEDYENGGEGIIVELDEDGAEIAFEKLNSRQYFYLSEYEVIKDSEKDQEIPWEVGQDVWCVLRGKGVVYSFERNISLWTSGVTVDFENQGTVRYNKDGKVSGGMNRSLYFSEPKIIAETMPPKKPFIPKFKNGDDVLIVGNRAYPEGKVFTVLNEFEDKFIVTPEGMFFMKKDIKSVRLLGDKVEFNV